jgi:hypothetical protein
MAARPFALSLSPAQRFVLGCMLAGNGLAFGMGAAALCTPAWSPLRAIDPLFLWAYAMIPIGLWLPLLVAVRASQRFLDAAQIAGQTQGLPVEAQVLQNTLEQTVIAALAAALLAISHAPAVVNLLLALAAGFAGGRLLFWWGYRRQPLARALGFWLTFGSSLFAYGYAAWFMLRAIR